jgi:hypothetical protein
MVSSKSGITSLGLARVQDVLNKGIIEESWVLLSDIWHNDLL